MVFLWHIFCVVLAKEEYPDAVCILNNIRFDLAGHLIASDSAYDVATFRVAADDVGKLANSANGKAILTGSQISWPPDPPQVDRGVFFVGFPGDGRAMRPYLGNSLVEIDWVGYTALAVAGGVSDTDITLVFDQEQDFDVGRRPAIPSDWALGGCSGAPLLTFVEQNGIFSWRLGGIIYESSSLILKASRADCLNIDGTLNKRTNTPTLWPIAGGSLPVMKRKGRPGAGSIGGKPRRDGPWARLELLENRSRPIAKPYDQKHAGEAHSRTDSNRAGNGDGLGHAASGSESSRTSTAFGRPSALSLSRNTT
jgi:hypothetical protein